MYQKIINLMPPHRVYVEAFYGGGAIMRTKRPAKKNIAIEINRGVYYEAAKNQNLPGDRSDYLFINDDFIVWLDYSDIPNRPGVLIYCDPPYLMSVRSSKRPIYEDEFHTDDEHWELLKRLKKLPCSVMISGYDSPLYNEMLADWRKVSFTGMTRGGPRTEIVWMNFDEPAELHDYRFLGETFRDRQDIKRQKERWLNRLGKMDSQKRFALLSAIEDYRNGENADNRSSIGEKAADVR